MSYRGRFQTWLITLALQQCFQTLKDIKNSLFDRFWQREPS